MCLKVFQYSHKKKNIFAGYTSLSVVFIILIASFFVVIVNEQRKYENNLSIASLDMNTANLIAELGVQLGLNEIKNQINLLSYTSGEAIFQDQDTSGLLGITGGKLTLVLAGIDGDLSDNQILVTATGVYNNSTRTIVMTVNKVLSKKMLMIQPVFDADSQFNDRISSFQNMGWEITTIPENNDPLELEPTITLPWDLIYLPNNITMDKETFYNNSSPIATELISNDGHFGIIDGTLSYQDNFTSNLYANSTTQTHTPSELINFSNNNTHFKTIDPSLFVTGVIQEFSPTLSGLLSVISWLPKNAVRSDSSLTPNARIILNIVPSDSYPWNLYINTGISALDKTLTYISSISTSNYVYEVQDITYS
jgi:hypothetical protein